MVWSEGLGLCGVRLTAYGLRTSNPSTSNPSTSDPLPTSNPSTLPCTIACRNWGKFQYVSIPFLVFGLLKGCEPCKESVRLIWRNLCALNARLPVCLYLVSLSGQSYVLLRTTWNPCEASHTRIVTSTKLDLAFSKTKLSNGIKHARTNRPRQRFPESASFHAQRRSIS